MMKILITRGLGKQRRDFTYIDDTIEACIRLMTINRYHFLNTANKAEWCIDDAAVKIKSMTNSSSEISFIEAPKMIRLLSRRSFRYL